MLPGLGRSQQSFTPKPHSDHYGGVKGVVDIADVASLLAMRADFLMAAAADAGAVDAYRDGIAVTDDPLPTDNFLVPFWSVRRIPTHGRLTPCGN